MAREKFLETFIEVLQTEEEITFETLLDDIEEWDSLSKMATIAFLDKNYSQKITFADVKEFKTVEDVAKKAGL